MKVYKLRTARWKYKTTDSDYIKKLMQYGVKFDEDLQVIEDGVISIETLEDLDKLISEFEHPLVVYKTSITIYDDYLE